MRVNSPTRHIAPLDLAAQRGRLNGRIEAAIERVLAHGAFIMGPEVAELEDQLCRYTGSPHTVTCSSGTDALVLSLLALGVEPGDAVVVPSLTFAATANAVALIGAIPVFVDVLPDTFNLDPADLDSTTEWASRSGLRCRAVIAVDLYGQPADVTAIASVAARHGLEVLADAAQSLGGEWAGQKVGTLTRLTATSFFPTKPLGCYGDGGAIFTNDADLADKLRSLRVHGQGRSKYHNIRVGTNARLDTIQAAVLIEKLAIFDEELERRNGLADKYGGSLPPSVITPTVDPRARSAWAQYTVRVQRRDEVSASLNEDGIPTAVYYPTPLHEQEAFSAFPRSPGGLPVSQQMAKEVLSLPLHPYLRAEDQDSVLQALGRAVAVTETNG